MIFHADQALFPSPHVIFQGLNFAQKSHLGQGEQLWEEFTLELLPADPTNILNSYKILFIERVA